MNEELIEQENKLYESTKDFGRIQFVREILKLQQENIQLQQLKDKDEKISKIKEYCLIEREDINGSKCDDILEILESNKED